MFKTISNPHRAIGGVFCLDTDLAVPYNNPRHPITKERESAFMSQLLYQLEGVRGRSILIYDRKCVISTKVSVGSLLTGNVTDGEKTIFYKDIVGVQFKRSGNLIGYLQFETGSVQMNNQNSNMFSENTFTFEHNKNGITNETMEAIYHQVCDLIEQIKYGSITTGTAPSTAVPVTAPAAAPAAKAAFCRRCGKELAPSATFCTGCGEKLR